MTEFTGGRWLALVPRRFTYWPGHTPRSPDSNRRLPATRWAGPAQDAGGPVVTRTRTSIQKNSSKIPSPAV